MFDDTLTYGISEETMAAWLDDMMTPEEAIAFMARYGSDPMVAEVLDANDEVVDAYEGMIEDGYDLPEELAGDFDLPFVSSAEDLFADNSLFADDLWADTEDTVNPEQIDAVDITAPSDSDVDDSTTDPLPEEMVADGMTPTESNDLYDMEDFGMV